MTDATHTPTEIANAIEIISMCAPIRDVQGGMWFGNNANFADATFVDYGACGAFAVAARMLAVQTAQNEAMRKALELFEALEVNCWDLRCIDIPTGGGDADVGWNVIEHHMAAPRERIVGTGSSPAEALRAALTAKVTTT